MKKTVAIFAFIALAISPATGQVAPPVGPMGISAAGIPLLNGNNTDSGTNIFNNPLSALNSGTSAQPSLAIGANNYGFYQSTNQLDSTIAGTQSVIIGNVAGWASISAPSGQFLGLNAATGSVGVLAINGTAAFYWNGTQFYPSATNTNSIGTSSAVMSAVYSTTYYGGSTPTVGVSCSGTPTASFASVGGIVTHC